MAAVLLIEDDPDIADILQLVLEGAGFVVTTARTAREARARIVERTEPFDTLLADKNLPDGSGLSLLEDLRRDGRDSELVMITGFPSVESAVQALRLGAYDYLEKPFRNLEDVAATVRRACEHRQLRRERDEARAAALAAERRATLVHVAAGIAHEVKNPLQGIGFACANARASLGDIPGDSPAARDALEQITLIEQESRRLRDLVEGVLDLARPTPRPARRLDVASMANTIVTLHQSAARAARVHVECVIEPGLVIVGDEGDLSRALDNLIRNALDAAPGGSTVHLRAANVENEWRIEVADEGPGFPAEERERVFQPFFTTKPRGFGLGLCQVAAAADRAGGSVEIHDNIPRGARMVLRLPIREQPGDEA